MRFYSDASKCANKNPLQIMSPEDLSSMKELVTSFDNEIHALIVLKQSIPIESLIEKPLLICHKIWETEIVDSEAKRYFRSIFIQKPIFIIDFGMLLCK